MVLTWQGMTSGGFGGTWLRTCSRGPMVMTSLEHTHLRRILIPEERWDHVMTLPTDVALKSSSYEGSAIARMATLETQWIWSWPEVDEAPFMGEVVLLADEEFDALVFNTLHGYYPQAIGCLRNALETMMAAAALAVTDNHELFGRWRRGEQQIGFRKARRWLMGSAEGTQVDRFMAPHSVFGDDDSSWTNSRYARLCAYAHSQAGYNNADFWESNGPIFVPRALAIVEQEFRQTLALCYLLLRLGWPTYRPGPARRPSPPARGLAGRGTKTSFAPAWHWTTCRPAQVRPRARR